MGPSVNVIVQPTAEPVTLDEAKQACRIDSDIEADDDDLLDMIATAREYIENTTGVYLISRTVLFTWDRFPEGSFGEGGGFLGPGVADDERVPNKQLANRAWPDRYSFRFPRSPIQSVSSIEYVDTGGTLQTLAASLYRVDYTSKPTRIEPSYGNTWPTELQQSQALKVTAVVGYGPRTTIAATTAVGQQTVTPASMYGIYTRNITSDPFHPGTMLEIDQGVSREIVTVTAVTGSTFTATFTKRHSANTVVRGAYPRTTRRRILTFVDHLFQNRGSESASEMPLAEQMLKWADWDGEL